MARAYYTCSCGHQDTIFGFNRRDAEGKAKWAEKQGHLCPDCYRAQKENERNAAMAAAAAKAREAGLPPLTGSDKQIAWGELLRTQYLGYVDAVFAALEGIAGEGAVPDPKGRYRATRAFLAALGSPDGYAERLAADAAEQILCEARNRERLEAFRNVLRRKTSAHWWIEWRDTPPGQRLRDMEAVIDEELRSLANAEEDAHPVAAAAKHESILKPAGDLVTPLVAGITILGRRIEARLAERVDAFAEAMKAAGLAWKETHWVRLLPAEAGDPVDRAAELAHRVLAAGIAVSLFDAAARAKAVDGSFAPEVTRWILPSTPAEDGAARCRIAWGRHEDFYDAANSLPGARYRDKELRVPVAAADAIEEFAARFGFSIAPAVRTAFAEHRAAMASGAVITSIVAAPEAVRGDLPERPVPLEVPAVVEIDAELRD